jgi:TAT (twin-arginine translocation) pathway signal sequence
MGNLSRRSFLKGAGVATGAAIIGATPLGAAAAGEPAPELVTDPSLLPNEPLVAYVRDADKAEVTVVAGTKEITYRDPLLVKRMQKHAAQQHRKGGEVA